MSVCFFSSKISSSSCTDLAGIFGTPLSGVSLPDDDPDAGQGSKFCLVAIGRLQVRGIFQWFLVLKACRAEPCSLAAADPPAGLAARAGQLCQAQQLSQRLPFLAGHQLTQLYRHEQRLSANRVHLPAQHRRHFHLHRPPLCGYCWLPATGERAAGAS